MEDLLLKRRSHKWENFITLGILLLIPSFFLLFSDFSLSETGKTLIAQESENAPMLIVQGKDQINSRLEYEFLEGDFDEAKLYLDRDSNECVYIETCPTSQGPMVFKLLVYVYSPLTESFEKVENTGFLCFESCDILTQGDPNILPPPSWGTYPYGLWRCRIHLKIGYFENKIDKEYRIYLTIKLPGDINPYHIEYYGQRYDLERDKISWEKIQEDYGFSYDFLDKTIYVRLYDTVHPNLISDENPIANSDQPGDIDPDEEYIEHIGGILLLPPGKERCFIQSVEGRIY